MKNCNDYFVPQTNIIHERAQFHQRSQRSGGKAETFIRALYKLSENCDFGANRNENIRDRLVVGIRDKDLSKRLQLIKDLTLNVAVQMVRQAEEVTHQVSQQGDPMCSVQEIRRPKQQLATGLSTAEKANLVKYGMARTNAADVAKQNIKTERNVQLLEQNVGDVTRKATGNVCAKLN